jgi:YD repeat-containing protein
MTSRVDAAGTTSYTYDGFGRLDTVANTGASVAADFTYNSLNLPTQVTYGSSNNSRYFGYDTSHRLVTDELKTSGGTSIAKITYGWDANGNETSKTTTGFGAGVTNTYTYDKANRLISWDNGTTPTLYAYDNRGTGCSPARPCSPTTSATTSRPAVAVRRCTPTLRAGR